MKARFAIPASLLALSFCLAAGAAELPAPTTANGITYLSGGIGREEALAMASEAKNYPLSLYFSAGKGNAFVADVAVKIKDQAGKVVLDSMSSGPIMLVRLPAGRYTISARTDTGAQFNRTVRVTASGDRRVDFHWPQA